MKVKERGVLEESEYYFFTPSNLAKSLFFHLMCTGKFFCDHNYYVERDKYNSYLLMYIAKGQGTICYNDKTYTAKENDLVIINCYEPHRYSTNTGWMTLWLHYDGNTSRELFDLIYDRFGCVIPMSNCPIIPKYMNIIWENARKCSPLSEPLISCYIQRMLVELLMLSNDFILQKTDEFDPVLEAMAFIETNFKEKLNLKVIASNVNISPFHFARTFKKDTGYSPYEYVMKIRLNHAKMLLKKTNLQIKEIAAECGFSTESNFLVNFHNNVGVTPREFRNTPF
ncbi:AraC family transcriptional regulator [Desulfosporosinus sp. PR]|uniref:AraC family transcriptional regulator n=1 Tax=Candidatus Desulfosporosinus nitrosoreducens TaxID=3401928 RepID=UPI0027E88229|nr:AraC family transcriptional regulator [Desulfosporosinus sp. PR]MDQ7095302.1 AraC family transcriptional regulator [Desulfosporosinus sp. PR]